MNRKAKAARILIFIIILNITSVLLYIAISNVNHGESLFVFLFLILFSFSSALAIPAKHLSKSSWKYYLLVMTAGGLLVTSFCSVLSIGPFLLPAVILPVVSSFLVKEDYKKSFIQFLLVFILSSLVIFAVLFRLIVSTGLEKTEIPLETEILKGYPFVDYADSFRIELFPDQNIDCETAAILVMQQMYPVWLKAPEKRYFKDYFAQRSKQTNGWKLVHKSSNEIIIRLNRSHIDLRLSILLRKEKNRRYLYLITIAKFNNLMGYLYFIPVKFGHQIVMANTLRKVKWCLMSEAIHNFAILRSRSVLSCWSAFSSL